MARFNCCCFLLSSIFFHRPAILLVISFFGPGAFAGVDKPEAALEDGEMEFMFVLLRPGVNINDGDFNEALLFDRCPSNDVSLRRAVGVRVALPKTLVASKLALFCNGILVFWGTIDVTLPAIVFGTAILDGDPILEGMRDLRGEVGSEFTIGTSG